MTETKQLYYRYETTKTDNGSVYTKAEGNAYVVVIRNGKDMRELCQPFGAAEHVDGLLDKVLGFMAGYGRQDAGTTDETSWNEPPRFNWSDPSCSFAGDGGVTSAVVYLDDMPSKVASDLAVAAVEVEFTDEELELWNKCTFALKDFIVAAIDKIDGTDIHEE